jgi:YidC/Oxa1 family membrane protein insertase
MKLTIALLSIASVSAFAPSARLGATRLTFARSFGVDPSHFHDLPQHFEGIQNAFSSMTLSDAMDGVADAVPFPSGDAVVEAAASDSGNGWFGFLTGPIQSLLYLIHSAFNAVGMDSNSWGVSIVVLTVLIKLLTFPLTKTQLESTNKMQVRYLTLQKLNLTYTTGLLVVFETPVSSMALQIASNAHSSCLVPVTPTTGFATADEGAPNQVRVQSRRDEPKDC